MFSYKHRVRYYETDKMGVAHHSSFVYWFENARVEFLRDLGIDYKDIENAGYNLAVVEINGRFLKPVFYDELISIKVKASRFDGKYAKFDYYVFNEKSETVVKGCTKHFVVDRELKRVKLPDVFLNKIKEKLQERE
ncbi:acyl-CoA thioesterase [Thermotomaculum hydrothermale]|nr:thioesterase family protein [Thermotomaculum hydrothermale]